MTGIRVKSAGRYLSGVTWLQMSVPVVVEQRFPLVLKTVVVQQSTDVEGQKYTL